jgi:ATP/ADP translocase
MHLDLSNCAWATGVFAALWISVYFAHQINTSDLIDTYMAPRIIGMLTGIACFVFAFPLGDIIQIGWLQITTITIVVLIGVITFLANLGSALDEDARAIDYARLA